MNKAEIKKLISKFNQLDKNEDYDEAEQTGSQIIEEMFKKQMYLDIVEFATKKFQDYVGYECFEVAYSLVDCDRKKEGKKIYEALLEFDPENTSILNNLSNLYLEENNAKEAYTLILRAIELKPDDETIQRNRVNIEKLIEQKKVEDENFKTSKKELKTETNWALQKLRNFVNSFNTDKELNNGELAISYKKFEWLIGTDTQKADSLREQWIKKNYIVDTGKRGEYSQKIYKLNPYLESYLYEFEPKDIPNSWLLGIDKFSGENLKSIGFYRIQDKVGKVKKKYREILVRDVGELYSNYLLGNKKATVILAGSIVETIFLYECEKKSTKQLIYSKNGKTKSIKIEDANINDFLEYFKQGKQYPAIVTSIADVSRIYRNMIHPANEIYKSKTHINNSKIEICFNAVLEIINEVL